MILTFVLINVNNKIFLGTKTFHVDSNRPRVKFLLSLKWNKGPIVRVLLSLMKKQGVQGKSLIKS